MQVFGRLLTHGKGCIPLFNANFELSSKRHLIFWQLWCVAQLKWNYLVGLGSKTIPVEAEGKFLLIRMNIIKPKHRRGKNKHKKIFYEKYFYMS